jgi:hypothetical protein
MDRDDLKAARSKSKDLLSLVPSRRAGDARTSGPRDATHARYRSAIGRRYGRIFNPYLFCARLSVSAAPRSKHLGCISTHELAS